MKSLRKAGSSALAAWTPPEIEQSAQSSVSNAHREKILEIFQKDSGERANKIGKVKKSAQKKHVEEWNPNILGSQIKNSPTENWSFIEVSNTPFDKSWKVTTPAPVDSSAEKENAAQEDSAQEKESAQMLENARHQAEEIILAAQSQADEILMQAQSEIEEQKEEGYQQGLIQARSETESATRAARQMAAEVEVWKSELTTQGEKILIGMLRDIAQKIFGEGVELNDSALQSNLNRVMENAHGLGSLKIFLNPRDAQTLDPYWSEQQMLILGEQVKIIPSKNVKPGGCMVKGHVGTIDAAVETQLDAILSMFDETAE